MLGSMMTPFLSTHLNALVRWVAALDYETAELRHTSKRAKNITQFHIKCDSLMWIFYTITQNSWRFDVCCQLCHH
jgi:hypothetical protein